jgi:hypothetical protein
MPVPPADRDPSSPKTMEQESRRQSNSRQVSHMGRTASEKNSEKNPTKLPSSTPRHGKDGMFKPTVLGLCVIGLLFAFVTIPSNVFDSIYQRLRPESRPHTIEQRVQRILTHTPLIGM